jgi:alcohol dehydrogenase
MPLTKDFKFLSVPKILSGTLSLENIPVELAGLGASRPLVLMGKTYQCSGADEKLIKSFGESGITIGALYDEAGSSAGLEDIIRLAGLYRWRNCDSIIAIGSGSVMDTARGVNLIVSTGNENIIQYSGTGNIPCRLKPLVSIPLPVLYGNETSNIAHIDGVKYISDYLYPHIIVTDPRLSVLAQKDSILESALSILSVSIDSALSPKGNPVRNFYLYSAINMICENLERMHEKPGNKKIKIALVNAGAIAGASCDSSNPGFISSAGLALSKETGLSPGTSIGIIMPRAIEYSYGHHGPHDSGILLAIAGHKIFSLTPEKQRGEVAAVMIKSWIDGHGSLIPKNLKRIKFPEYRIQSVSENAEFLSGGLYKSSEFLSVFTSAMTGEIERKEKEKISFDLNKVINSTFGLKK